MLSHSGSHIPRPTLKPNITALAPRSRYQLLVRLYWIGIPPTLYQASIGTHCVCVCVYSAKAFSVFLFHIFSLSPLFLLFYYILFLFSSVFLFFTYRICYQKTHIKKREAPLPCTNLTSKLVHSFHSLSHSSMV